MNYPMLNPGKTYIVTKRIKVHTSPIRTEVVTKKGKFLRETKTLYVFDSFRVRKDVIERIEGIG